MVRRLGIAALALVKERIAEKGEEAVLYP